MENLAAAFTALDIRSFRDVMSMNIKLFVDEVCHLHIGRHGNAAHSVSC